MFYVYGKQIHQRNYILKWCRFYWIETFFRHCSALLSSCTLLAFG